MSLVTIISLSVFWRFKEIEALRSFKRVINQNKITSAAVAFSTEEFGLLTASSSSSEWFLIQ
jgi:hypothetical protein